MKDFLSIMKTIVIIVLAIVLIVNMLFLIKKIIFKQDLPKIFGFSQAIVTSGSMEPVFLKGDMIIFKEKSKYDVNDIIIFRQNGIFITHRISAIEGDEYTTKGDSNIANDKDSILLNQIEGKMIMRIPSVGTISIFMKEKLGFLIAVAIIILILFAIKGIYFIKQEGDK